MGQTGDCDPFCGAGHRGGHQRGWGPEGRICRLSKRTRKLDLWVAFLNLKRWEITQNWVSSTDEVTAKPQGGRPPRDQFPPPAVLPGAQPEPDLQLTLRRSLGRVRSHTGSCLREPLPGHRSGSSCPDAPSEGSWTASRRFGAQAGRVARRRLLAGTLGVPASRRRDGMPPFVPSFSPRRGRLRRNRWRGSQKLLLNWKVLPGVRGGGVTRRPAPAASSRRLEVQRGDRGCSPETASGSPPSLAPRCLSFPFLKWRHDARFAEGGVPSAFAASPGPGS